MVMNSSDFHEPTLETASEEALLDEVARRHHDAPLILVAIDPQAGFYIHSTIDTKMPPVDILKSLAEAIERFEADYGMEQYKKGNS